MTRKAWFALTAPSAVLLVAWWLWRHAPPATLMWLLGIALGVVLQRSRYCVAAAFRDTVLFNDTGMARSVLLAVSIASVTFGTVYALRLPAGALPLAAQPLSAGTVIGPLLFGIGMIPAGGCAASTLLRLGEGHLRFAWTLLGLILGSLLGAYHYGWWEALLGSKGPVFLPAVLGWPAAIALQGALLVTVYFVIRWWERKGELLW
ncbi:MAG TPA: YeeE/YedE thiosulfate transporter family protein [Symbiobacteriaceae bacterium]|nr:YeeE/YedE thiosulfate transporter family protein [Symbiobacteriaceae bacterium]